MTVPDASPLTIETLREPVVRHDPYPFYRTLRERAPVLWDSVRWQWVLTRHQDVMTALRSPALSAARMSSGDELPPGVPTAMALFARQLLFLDPPDHTRLRRLISKAFTPRMVEGLRPAITSLVDDLLDRALERGRMDVVDDLALTLPVDVIAEMLGVPRQDRGQLRAWSGSFGRLLDDEGMDEAAFFGAMTDLGEFVEYLSDLVEIRRRAPREDLISQLATVEEHGDQLSREELLANLVLVLAAGHLTTTHLLGNGVLALLRHPEQWRLLCGDPSVVPSAVQELLRYDSPVQRTDRLAVADVEIGGRQIRAGQSVVVMLGAANRDPEAFPDPDRLDLRRDDSHPLAFGHGIHTCLGMALARAEGEIAFGRLAARLPGLRLDEDGIVERDQSLVFRGLRHLPVRWD
ncbi:cytochrome P450 [Allostreptomyces psammosilenae]|uniref:Cytochrome P450 n=1 Tax=Allostreptomyces psammosilenae TaxID=1892865 RepID=A0A853A1K8_9ACTN|nr:cytochrome P450 [Allostreptomyces psammosilenae]NYI08295.1 hypothetical protein [Allostreptomyces psammosilenae]